MLLLSIYYLQLSIAQTNKISVSIPALKNSRAEVVSLVCDVKRGCEVCGEKRTHGETKIEANSSDNSVTGYNL